MDLIESRAKRLGLRREDLEDAQQQIVVALLGFAFDAGRSNGATEETVITSIIDHQLFTLLRAKRRYEDRMTSYDEIRSDDPVLAREWLDGYRFTIACDVKVALACLSPTARQVCAALAEGLSLHQVAQRLGMGWHTVHAQVRHIRRCFERLGIDNLVTAQSHQREHVMADIVKFSPGPAGLSGQNEAPVESSRIVDGGSVPRSWITRELLQETCEVWSRAYGRPISADEAKQILVNVMLLSEVLMHVQSARNKT